MEKPHHRRSCTCQRKIHSINSSAELSLSLGRFSGILARISQSLCAYFRQIYLRSYELLFAGRASRDGSDSEDLHADWSINHATADEPDHNFSARQRILKRFGDLNAIRYRLFQYQWIIFILPLIIREYLEQSLYCHIVVVVIILGIFRLQKFFQNSCR